MSGGETMAVEIMARDAVIAAFGGDGDLVGQVNAVFDGAPARATPPYVVVGECQGSDWGAKDIPGRELRLSVSLHDAGQATGRLAQMMARVDPVLQGLTNLGEGWRVVSARLLRSRLSRAPKGEAGWQAAIDYRLRVVRE